MRRDRRLDLASTTLFRPRHIHHVVARAICRLLRRGVPRRIRRYYTWHGWRVALVGNREPRSPGYDSSGLPPCHRRT